jgi:hypothetical protein
MIGLLALQILYNRRYSGRSACRQVAGKMVWFWSNTPIRSHSVREENAEIELNTPDPSSVQTDQDHGSGASISSGVVNRKILPERAVFFDPCICCY